MFAQILRLVGFTVPPHVDVNALAAVLREKLDARCFQRRFDLKNRSRRAMYRAVTALHALYRGNVDGRPFGKLARRPI